MKSLCFLLLVVLMCTFVGCAAQGAKQSSDSLANLPSGRLNSPFPDPQELLPENQAEPIDLRDAKVTGTLEPKDLDTLRKLVGRIPQISRKVKRIEAVWGSEPVAAMISMDDNHFIFCVRDAEGTWLVSKIKRIWF